MYYKSVLNTQSVFINSSSSINNFSIFIKKGNKSRIQHNKRIGALCILELSNESSFIFSKL